MSAKNKPIVLHPSEESALNENELRPPSPHRQKVVEMAVQLVSAQIVATSHYETAMELTDRIHRMVVDFTEKLSTKAAEVQYPDSVISALAQPMKGWRPPSRSFWKPRVLNPMSHPDLDRLFNSAMYRVQRMLESPEQSERLIYAEQLFQPDEVISENQIILRFQKYRWPEMASRQPVIDHLSSIDSWFASHYSALSTEDGSHKGKKEISRTDQTLPLDGRIADAAGELNWLLQKAKTHGASDLFRDHYSALGESLDSLSHAQGRPFLEDAFIQLECSERRNLVFMIYGESEPKPRDIKPQTKRGDKKVKSPTRFYRPWGLFRYLRRYGNVISDREGVELNLKLRTAQSLLDSEQIPNIDGLFPREFEFGPIGKDMEDLLASMEDGHDEGEGGVEDLGDLPSL